LNIGRRTTNVLGRTSKIWGRTSKVRNRPSNVCGRPSNVNDQPSNVGGPTSEVRGRTSKVARNHRQSSVLSDDCRRFELNATLSGRVSHMRGHSRRKFFRQSTIATVARELMEKWRNMRHFGDSQFLYTWNGISLNLLHRASGRSWAMRPLAGDITYWLIVIDRRSLHPKDLA
jgi:hypothetical protein